MEKSGANPIEVRKGIVKAIKVITEKLDAMSSPIETIADIKQVATISANGDESVGDLIADAMTKVGKTGVITIKDSKTIHDELEVCRRCGLCRSLRRHINLQDRPFDIVLKKRIILERFILVSNSN